MMTKTHDAEQTTSFVAVKRQILSARQRAATAVNREMLALFWQLGREILALESTEHREGQTIDELAAHLRGAFADTLCFSTANLEHMRAFAKAWPGFATVEPVLVQLPWEHHVVLLSALDTPRQRLAYARRAVANGWSSATLALHVGKVSKRAKRDRRGASMPA